jgi:hypothetical protein
MRRIAWGLRCFIFKLLDTLMGGLEYDYRATWWVQKRKYAGWTVKGEGNTWNLMEGALQMFSL